MSAKVSSRKRVGPTGLWRIRRDDIPIILSFKTNFRETIGDVVHRLVTEEVARRREKAPESPAEAVPA